MNTKVENHEQGSEEIWFLGEGGESKEKLSDLQEQVAFLGKEVIESEFKKYLTNHTGSSDIENHDPTDLWNLHYEFHLELTKLVKHLDAELLQKVFELGLTVEFLEEPMENRESSYWYGGGVAKISKGNTSLILDANGDVRCYFRSIDNEEETEIFVKDHNNSGNFYRELDGEIENDEKLKEYTQNYLDDKYPQLEVQENNWWEVFVVIDGEWYDIMCALAADTYSEALKLLIEDFDDYVGMV